MQTCKAKQNGFAYIQNVLRRNFYMVTLRGPSRETFLGWNGEFW